MLPVFIVCFPYPFFLSAEPRVQRTVDHAQTISDNQDQIVFFLLVFLDNAIIRVSYSSNAYLYIPLIFILGCENESMIHSSINNSSDI